MKQPVITIGISAFNEAQTISGLLKDLCKQLQRGFVIDKIIVSSDGSNDSTVRLAREINDPRVRVLDYKKRMGKAYRQNQFFEMVNSDVLVILDADVRMRSRDTVAELIIPILKGEASLTSAQIYESTPRSFIEQVLFVSMKLKSILFSTFHNGNNVYHCHGPIRAFAKDLYKTFRFELDEGEDMYSYLACVSQGKRFSYVYTAGVTYKLPNVIEDHKKQSYRYHQAKQCMKAIFGQRFVEKECTIPLSTYVVSAMKSLPYICKNLILTCAYVCLFVYVRCTEYTLQKTETWSVGSTKCL